MKIVIVTDAWKPQVNGVVTTLEKTGDTLRSQGHEVNFITPNLFRTIPMPTYPEIRLAIAARKKVWNLLAQYNPDAVHIATEGPLGYAARRYCRKHGLEFTTSYHTQFPEYIRLRAPIPLKVSYAVLRWFHGGATRTLVATQSQRNTLIAHGFNNLVDWSRGVDTDLFYPRDKNFLNNSRPISMYMGRVAIEKNIEAFLSLDIPGSKYVVGDGPDINQLKRKHPEVTFTGVKLGDELASHLAAADIFVFPSRTDTFGLVMLEAMACGVPVAAYPVTGPVDVIKQGETGIMHDDLGVAVREALKLDGETARQFALSRSWQASTQQFFSNLAFN